MKAGKAASETFNLCIVLSYNHFISSISCSFLHPTCLSLPHPSFSSLIFSPSFSLPLFSLSCFFHILPPSLRTRSLIASCCHKSNYIGVVSMGNRLLSSPPPPISHLITHCYHHLTPHTHTPSPSLSLCLSTYLSTPLPLFLSLCLTHTDTHTQNEQINYVAMLVREEITVVRDDKTGDVERSHCKQQLLPKKIIRSSTSA